MEPPIIFKPFCAVYTVILKNSRVLLIKRKNQEFPDGYFSFPANHLDSGESPTIASSRIFRQQAGVSLESDRMKFVHVSYRQIGERNYVDFFFSATLEEYEEDSIQNMDPSTCLGLEWFEISELPVNILPYIRTVILDLTQDINFREFGWESSNVNLE